MSSAAEVLVVILSIFLAFFLILGITLTIYLIKLTRQIKKVTDSAERTAESIESTVTGFSRLISPMVMAEMIAKAVKGFKNKKRKED